jgi:hypothetical protein
VPDSSHKTVTALINYSTPDKLFKIESCLGIGCHVLIEQGEAQNHPTMIGVDIKKAGIPEAISRNQLPFGKVIYITNQHIFKVLDVDLINIAFSFICHLQKFHQWKSRGLTQL